jgi:hypothetical protein
MAVFLSPVWNEPLFKSDGTFAVGYKIWTRIAGSSTPVTTYTAADGLTANANPITLDARGQVPSQIWISEGVSIDIILTDDSGDDVTLGTNVTIDTQDDVRGINDTTTTQDQWQASGLTPTYISATSFSLVGDQTSAFHVGRKIKTTNSGGTIYSTISASTFGAVTTVTVVNDSGVLDAGLSAVSYALLTSTNDSLPGVIDSNVQNQTATAFTTGGSSSAFTLTPIPAIAANAENQCFFVEIHTDPTGSPTLAISGKSALNCKYLDSNNVKQFITTTQVKANNKYRVWNDGTDYMFGDILPPSPAGSRVQPITASVSSNALTVTVNPTTLDFRSSTLSSGTVNTRTLSNAVSVVVSSGSTLGTTSAVAARLAVLLIDNAGTLEAAVVNIVNGLLLDESNLISTTAEGGAGAADTAGVIYSTTARSNVSYRVVGYLDITEATAGTWASAATRIQGAGGLATNLIGIGVGGFYESPLQTITAAGALTLPHGLGRRPRWVMAWLVNQSTEAGYTSGQYTPAFAIADDSASSRGYSLIADETNLTIRFGSAAATFIVFNTTTGVRAAITNSNWRFVVEALA